MLQLGSISFNALIYQLTLLCVRFGADELSLGGLHDSEVDGELAAVVLQTVEDGDRDSSAGREAVKSIGCSADVDGRLAELALEDIRVVLKIDDHVLRRVELVRSDIAILARTTQNNMNSSPRRRVSGWRDSVCTVSLRTLDDKPSACTNTISLWPVLPKAEKSSAWIRRLLAVIWIAWQ